MANPTVFPRFSACFDFDTAAAIRREAGARMERPADLIRTAVQNELRVRAAATAAVAAERARQGETARRLHMLVEAGPGAVSARVAAQVAEIACPAADLAAQADTAIARALRAPPFKRIRP